MRVRILTTGGKQPEIVQAVERDGRTVFIDTLGERWDSSQVISFRPIVDQAGNPL
jgi:hypothetical protein